MPAFFCCLVAAVRPRARLYPSIEYAIDATRLPGSRRWRGGRASSASVDAIIDNVGWDAAPRTEHAVLAAGEALEVAAAAHFCCASCFFACEWHRLDDVWPASKAACSVHSL